MEDFNIFLKYLPDIVYGINAFDGHIFAQD